MFVATFLGAYVGTGYGGVIALGDTPLMGSVMPPGYGAVETPNCMLTPVGVLPLLTSPPSDARRFSILASVLAVMKVIFLFLRRTSSCN